MSELLTTKQSAEIANVHPRTIINWIKNGWLPAIKKPGSRGPYRVYREHLDAVIHKEFEPHDRQ